MNASESQLINLQKNSRFNICIVCKIYQNIHNLPVQDNQIQDLRNIGYYHGYKGYRFVRKSGNLINFTAFGQIVDLNNFDMQLMQIIIINVYILYMHAVDLLGWTVGGSVGSGCIPSIHS